MSDVKKPKYSVKVITAPIQKAEQQTSLAKEEESAAGEWIRPNYALRGLEVMVENSSILPQCIRAYKGNIAGFGIAVKYKDDVEETSEMSEEFTKAETIIRRLNNDKDITEVFEDIVEARETYGIAFAEVIRTLDGDVVQLEFIEDTPSVEKSAPLNPYVDYTYYDNGEEVKARKRFRKYKQQIGGKTVYFKEFGDPRTMDLRDGRYIEEDGEELDAEYTANEIIDFPIGTKPYGTVRWIGQSLGIDGSRRAENLNNNYFINGRHTPMMIMLQGGSLSDKSYTELQNYMNDIKGENGQHAFIVLEVEETDSRADFDAAEKPQIQIKDMAAMLQKDELFQGYLDNNRRRTQSSFLLPDLYVGYTTDFNRATAQTAQEVTEQQVFQPERNSLAWIVNNKLLNGYNFKHVEAYFRAPDLNNPEDLANLLNICNAAGGLTPNKAKSILYNALGEVSEDYEGDWANEPLARAGMQADPAVEEQLEKQIAKAAAHGNDEVVAVMKEVRNLLQKGSKKNFTNPNEYGIMKEWQEELHPRNPDGTFKHSHGKGRGQSAGTLDDDFGFFDDDDDPPPSECVGKVDFNDKEAVMECLRQYQEEWKNLDHEMNCTVTTDGRVWITDGSSGNVNNLGIERGPDGHTLQGSYSYHNHPDRLTNHSLSGDDVQWFFQTGEDFSVASDSKFEYYMKRTSETIIPQPIIEISGEFDRTYWKDGPADAARDKKIDNHLDGFHETMIIMSQRYQFEYQRRPR